MEFFTRTNNRIILKIDYTELPTTRGFDTRLFQGEQEVNYFFFSPLIRCQIKLKSNKRSRVMIHVTMTS